MKVTQATSAMPFTPPAGDKGPRLNARGLTWEPVMLMGIRARIVTMQMWMLGKKYRKAMMD
jgi:hypothetical protein